MNAFYECILKFIRDRNNEYTANKIFNAECKNKKREFEILK